MSTIRDADLIYVMGEGRIVQQGTHRSLIKQEGVYRTLWLAQSGSDMPWDLSPDVAAPAGVGRINGTHVLEIANHE